MDPDPDVNLDLDPDTAVILDSDPAVNLDQDPDPAVINIQIQLSTLIIIWFHPSTLIRIRIS